MALTYGVLYAGGGLADCGLRAAGYTPAWAVEIDADVCAVYRQNHGDHIICAAVEDVDPHTLQAPDLLWASPSCRMHSQARSNALEVDDADATMGLAIIPYLEILRPRAFILENVPPFQHSDTFKQIVAALYRCGYMVHWQNVCSSWYGVPQTRNRLILRASRDSLLPPLPPKQPVIGWYAAIEDLIPTLPESQFAPWQLKRLTEHDWASPFLHMTANTNIANPTGTGVVPVGGLANTVTPASGAARAYLMSNAATEWGDGIRAQAEPSHAITTQAGGRMRALLVSGTDATIRDGSEPAHTLTATLDKHTASPRALLLHPTASGSDTFPPHREGEPACTVLTGGGMPRALLVDGENSRADGRISVRHADTPALTVNTYGKRGFPKAFVVDCTTGERLDEAGNRMLTVRGEHAPMFTVTAGANRRPIRAGIERGRVVSMIPRSLARFQSVPDTYMLPSKRALALSIIGNGVACRVAQILAEQFVPLLEQP